MSYSVALAFWRSTWVINRDNVLEMIEDHITNNVVRVPAAGGSGKGAYFRQVQGSVIVGTCVAAREINYSWRCGFLTRFFSSCVCL